MTKKQQNPPNRRSVLRMAGVAGLVATTGCLGSVFGRSDANAVCETTGQSGRGNYLGGVGLYARNENPQTVYFIVGVMKSALKNGSLHLILIYNPNDKLLYDIPIFRNSIRPELKSKSEIGWLGKNEVPFPIDVGSPPHYGQYRVVAKDKNGKTLQTATARSSCYVDRLQ